MKTFKLFLTLLVAVNLLLTSCQQNDAPNEITDNSLEDSATTKMVLNNINTKLEETTGNDSATALQNNLEFDYCFNFVYPITLAYNNGTEVVIADISQLLTVVASMTEAQYISGISFPFDISTLNGVETINNEADFLAAVTSCDTDQDGTPNYEDTDDDNDGVADVDEDVNNDGDTTNDDTDGDGLPNYQDTDDDGDGIDTADEDVNGDGDPTNDDTDGDGIADYEDEDDDNDGVPTAEEDNDHDGNVANDDSDGDGIPDYQDTDSDNDGIEDGEDTDADGDGQDDDTENENGEDNEDNEDGEDGDDDGNGGGGN